MFDHMPYVVLKVTAELSSITVVVGSIFGYMPNIAATLGVIYWGIEIYRLIKNWNKPTK
jgi:hypothetical protein